MLTLSSAYLCLVGRQFDFDSREISRHESKLTLIVAQAGPFDGSNAKVVVVVSNLGPNPIKVPRLMSMSVLRVEITNGSGKRVRYLGDELETFKVGSPSISHFRPCNDTVPLKDGHCYGFSLECHLTHATDRIAIRAYYDPVPKEPDRQRIHLSSNLITMEKSDAPSSARITHSYSVDRPHPQQYGRRDHVSRS